jgi:hypothetical protein
VAERTGRQWQYRAQAPGGSVPFTGQLSSPAYVLDARPQRARPVRGRTAAVTAGRSSPCVVLLSRSCDAELDAVEDLLGQVGVPFARINADELAGVDLLVDPGNGSVCLNGDWLMPTVTWSRHFSALAIEGSGGPVYDLFLRDSWQAVASQLSTLSGTSIQARRPGPLEQLLLAERHQIAVPRTIITTDAGEAKGALRSSRVVVKAVHQHFVEAVPGRLSGVFPAVMDRNGLTSLPRPGPPVMVQEYVEHDAELRVYYVDGQVYGFEVSKETPADLWLAADRVGVQCVDPPPAVVSATRLLASALSLRYGAFDFLIRTGAPVFLEVNPDGDWRWIETKTRTAQVTSAVAQMLCDLHRATPTGRGTNSFDLMAFLSATHCRWHG